MSKDHLRQEFYRFSYDYLKHMLPKGRAADILVEHLDLCDASTAHVTLNQV